MRKIICGIAACLCASVSQAAIPSLAELATGITTLRERLESATNETGVLRAKFAAVTNMIAKLERVANMDRDTRRAYHGKELASRFETNEVTRTIQRVDVYEDGYEHVNQAKVRLYTTEELAARAAMRRSGADSAEARIAKLRAEIARLEEEARSTNRLDAAHATIRLVAAERNLERLLATSQTNVVDVVVTP